MTDPTSPASPRKLDPARLAAILDAGAIVLGVLAVSVGAGLLLRPAAGLVAFGSLLLGAELAAAVLRR